MKHCPYCKYIAENPKMLYCPHCSNKDGRGMVYLIYDNDEILAETKDLSSEGLNRIKKEDRVNHEHINYRDEKAFNSARLQYGNNSNNGIRSNTKIGNSNVFSGDDNSTNTYISYEKELSEAERLYDSILSFHNYCLDRCKNGSISDEDINELNALRDSLKLRKEVADKILSECLDQSIRKHTELSHTDKIILQNTRTYIENCDFPGIQLKYNEISELRQRTDVNEVNQIYYQLKAILTPDKFIDDIKDIHSDSYWEVYWSYVAYILVGAPNTGAALGNLKKWDYQKPYQNQILLLTIGALMNNKVEEAKSNFRLVKHGFDESLQPLYDAVNELLNNNWNSELTDISPRNRFYVLQLFADAYRDLRNLSEQNEAIRLKEQKESEDALKEKNNKQEDFLIRYEKNDGDEGKTLELSLASLLELNEWKRLDANFVMALRAIDNRIAEKKEKEAADAAAAEAAAAKASAEAEVLAQQIYKQKEDFKTCYKDYKCNLTKACADLKLSPEVIKEWRTNDAVFNNAIVNIEEEYKKWVDEQNAIRRKRLSKKILPYVLSGLLVVAGILGILYLLNKGRINAQAEQEFAAQRDMAISNYNETVDHLKDFISSIPDDVKKVSIEKDVTTLDSCYTILCKVFNLEKDPILSDIQQVSVDLKERLINKTFGIFEYAKDLGSAPPNIPDYKKLQDKGQKYMSTIDSLKLLITSLK